jgi:hypothetical protein
MNCEALRDKRIYKSRSTLLKFLSTSPEDDCDW